MSYPVAVDRNGERISVCNTVVVAWGDTLQPATIRQIFVEDGQTLIEVLWRSEISVSQVPPSSVQLMEASEIDELERLEAQMADTWKEESEEESKEESKEERVEVVLKKSLDQLRIEDCVTPSMEHMPPEIVEDYPWICHMCMKKMASLAFVKWHLGGKTHRKKKGKGTYTFESSVKWAGEMGFYNVESVESRPPADPPPPPSPWPSLARRHGPLPLLPPPVPLLPPSAASASAWPHFRQSLAAPLPPPEFGPVEEV